MTESWRNRWLGGLVLLQERSSQSWGRPTQCFMYRGCHGFEKGGDLRHCLGTSWDSGGCSLSDVIPSSVSQHVFSEKKKKKKITSFISLIFWQEPLRRWNFVSGYDAGTLEPKLPVSKQAGGVEPMVLGGTGRTAPTLRLGCAVNGHQVCMSSMRGTHGPKIRFTYLFCKNFFF